MREGLKLGYKIPNSLKRKLVENFKGFTLNPTGLHSSAWIY
jgi:hypothetical protein